MTDVVVDGAGTPTETAHFAAGAQVRVRDEQWLVRKVTNIAPGEWMLEVTGVSAFVRGTDAVFYTGHTGLDTVEELDPRHTTLVGDESPHHRKARLYLEAVIRKTALPQTERGLALEDGFLMTAQSYQLRPAELALSLRNPLPRLLIGDIVGLGKTLEIGILLAELIRRGRAERILVVTPAHVLEQFQRELWTRFSIPLVRLDTTGIQRIQQEIPAGRNPFAYFKRAIISVDTLKGRGYADYLEQTDWEVVVIDESHNLVNKGTQNNKLAARLAERTDALVLASATPHNGDARSFAELIGLLDETAIANPARFDVDDLDHVFIRRTKNHPEVRDSLTGDWADRGASVPVHVPANPAERAVLEELATRWIPRDPEAAGVGEPLTAYGLFKAFLSSPKALQQTIDKRATTLAKAEEKARTRTRTPEQRAAEAAALSELATLVEQIDMPAKTEALIRLLREFGVGPSSATRVVVFSERIETLNWLAEVVPAQLGLAEDATAVLHGDLGTVELQRSIVDEFGLQDSPVRVLFTGDIASEGVNLHHQCHRLIHYDLPWSLIRIEQRNGRIDRYGQAHSPEYRALLLTADVEWRTGEDGEPLPFDDRLVGQKLLAREEQAHKIEGTAEAVTGLYGPREEEERLTRDLIAGKTVEASITDSKEAGEGFLANLMGTVTTSVAEVTTAEVPTLFPSHAAYFDEALRFIYPGGPEDAIRLRCDEDGTIAFEPPPDLQYRLRWLPHSYLKEQGILPSGDRPGRLRMTFYKELGEKRRQAALDSGKTQWPNVSYVSPVHPVLDWVTDKALASLRHDQAFVLAADVEQPVYLVQGVYSNTRGHPTVVEWMAVHGLPGQPAVTTMDQAFLTTSGVTPDMPGRAQPLDRDGLQRHVPQAIDVATKHLMARRDRYDAQVDEMLAPYLRRLDGWTTEQLQLFGPLSDEGRKKRERRQHLVDSLRTSGAPMTRLLAVLEPR